MRKKIAKIVRKRQGNAVHNFIQKIDHEHGGETRDRDGERTLVVRAIGVAVLISKVASQDKK